MGGGLPAFQRAPAGVGAGAGCAGGAPAMMPYGNPAAAGFPLQQQRAGVMGAGMGMGVGVGVGMRPAGAGVGVGTTVPAGGKVIPDVSALGVKTAGAAGGWQQQQQQQQQQGQEKAPDSFSFVMDAMQDSIK